MSLDPNALKRAGAHLEDSLKYKKCWRCGCQQQTVREIEKSLGSLSADDREALMPLLERAKATFVPVEYDCLGCKVCFPAELANELAHAYPLISSEGSCGAVGASTEEERVGWPPLPGNYEVRRYRAPIAVCTLNSKGLIREVAKSDQPGISLVGSLSTENLGIERLIKNIIANPNIRFLVLCGEDSRQRIGHLPGQSLVSLFENGVDESGRIIGAQGKRPMLKNLDASHVERFRGQVELVPLIGSLEVSSIVAAVAACEARNPGRFAGSSQVLEIPTVKATPMERLVLDPAGYFVIFLDRPVSRIIVEHYGNDGVLTRVVEGRGANDIYATAIRLGLVTRLDHAAYLGTELARAESAMKQGEPYEQDKAPGDVKGEPQ
jgi:tetrahydromethanopterin S-methyltransferase subunit A